MNRALLWIICITLSLGLLVVSGTRAARERAAVLSAKRDLTTVSSQVAELSRLRSTGGRFSLRSDGALASRVSAALARAGLSGQVLQSLSPEAQSPITRRAGSLLIRQRATLTLHNLSLPQAGMFLDAWCSVEPEWIISHIDLSPILSKEAPSIGTDLPLRVVVTIEGLFRAKSGDSR